MKLSRIEQFLIGLIVTILGGLILNLVWDWYKTEQSLNNYKEIVLEADSEFRKENYGLAKELYQLALRKNSSDKYVIVRLQECLAKINGVNEATKNSGNYLSNFAKRSKEVIYDLDHNSIIEYFFDTKKKYENKYGVWHEWKPKLDNESYWGDSKIREQYTQIVNEFDFKIGLKKLKLFVFMTNQSAGHDCNACAPAVGMAVISKNEKNRWTVEDFRKKFTMYGRRGFVDSTSLVKIGRNRFAICLYFYTPGGGHEGEYVALYDLLTKRKIFEYSTFKDNWGYYGDERIENVVASETHIEFVDIDPELEYYPLKIDKNERLQRRKYIYHDPVFLYFDKKKNKYLE